MRTLKLGLPKGSLQESTIQMFRKAGFNVRVSERSYLPTIDDDEIAPVMLRAQEMSRYVEEGVLDAGLTGSDWILENDSEVATVEELVYAKSGLNRVRWVIAVPNGSKIHGVKDLKGKRIATELVNVTRKFLAKRGVRAEVEFSWGATEVKVGASLVDAIVELTETGASLRANNLRIVDTVCESATQLIANKASFRDAWKRKKMESIALLLKGALLAESKVGLKMNVAQRNLATVIKLLPALKKPTISSLSQEGWYDIDTVIDEKVVRSLVPRLKDAGAEGIIEYPLNKVIY